MDSTAASLASLDTVIIVPGHAVYVGTDPGHSRVTAHWRGTFPGYQENDEAELYREHVRTGVLLAARGEEPRSLLIFSGGETRRQAGPYSEAQSYWFLASQNKWFEHPEVEQRATTEEYARDSFENLLFSVHRFRQCTGHLPRVVVVCGFSFKKKRYHFHWETMCDHCSNPSINLEGLQLVKNSFTYVEVNDPPPYILKGPGGSEDGEEATRRLWEQDCFGERPPLKVTEQKRNPFTIINPYGLER
jgi:hypothetical protein